MKSRNIVLIILIFITSLTSGQSSFQIGTGQLSIEPDKSLISLALSGYAAPGEGRFTLQWKNQESLPSVTAITGLSNWLYLISNSELICKDITQSNSTWKKAGEAKNIRALAGLNDKLYAVNNNGELLVSKVGKIKWKKISFIDKSVASLTLSGNKIYAVNNRGSLWSANLLIKEPDWSLIKTINGIISLTALNGELYALTNEGAIFKADASGSQVIWVKIAYKNNITIKEDIRYITIVENGIYGVSKENVLYAGEHRSDGNLSARAMAIKNNDKTTVIINVDLVSLSGQFIGMLKEEIFKKHNIPASAVMVNISHTHFAPVVQDWPTWVEYNQHPNKIYLYTIVKNGILGAVDKAVEDMAPAQLFFGRGKTDIGYNRSLNDHPELYDNSVDVLKVKYDDNSERYLFLASCHAVFSTAGKLHYTISANFPGIARKLTEERTGTVNSLFLQGTAGDINPRDNGEYISGEKLSNEIVAVLNRPMTEIKGPITFFLDTFNIPIKPWTKEELSDFKVTNSGKPKDLGAEKNIKWADLMLKYYENGTMPESNPVYVQTINVGNWKLVGFSRETTTAYSLSVKEMWPDNLVSVAGYTNDVSSYLPTNMHVQKRNYEGLDSFFWYGAIPFPANVDESIMQQIKKLRR
jgi:hypothetical protein